jgi:hypothetical protein
VFKNYHYDYWNPRYTRDIPLIVDADKVQQDIEAQGPAYSQAYSLWSTERMEIFYTNPETMKQELFPRASKVRECARNASSSSPLQDSIYNLLTRQMTKIKSNGCCSECGKALNKDVTIDHRYPKLVFPKRTFDTDEWRFSHYSCNHKKGSLFGQEIADDAYAARLRIAKM